MISKSRMQVNGRYLRWELEEADSFVSPWCLPWRGACLASLRTDHFGLYLNEHPRLHLSIPSTTQHNTTSAKNNAFQPPSILTCLCARNYSYDLISVSYFRTTVQAHSLLNRSHEDHIQGMLLPPSDLPSTFQPG
jgi:hypothetical protein